MASQGTRGFLGEMPGQVRSRSHDPLHERGSPEGEGLHASDVVPIVAGDPGQARLPHLPQLLLREGRGVGGGVIEEPDEELGPPKALSPVTMVETLELVADQAAEGGSQQTAGHSRLADTADEQVDVVHRLINQLQAVNNLIRDVVNQVVKVRHSAQATQLPEAVVAGEAVVSATLDIQGRKVHTKAVVLGLEEVVGQLVGHDIVKPLPWLGGQTHQEAIKASGYVH